MSGRRRIEVVLAAIVVLALGTAASANAATVQLTADAYSVVEGRDAVVTLVSSGQAPVTVSYATTDGTATAPADYIAVAGSVTLPASDGPVTTDITIPTVADRLTEGDETLTLDLTATDAGNALRAPSSATLTILDRPNTQQIALLTPSATVTENAGHIVLGVLRTGGAIGTATVDYSSGGGNAIGGVDYTPVAGTLTFGPGEGFKTIDVPILQNQVVDGPRSFAVTLSGPDALTTLGDNASETIAITDDDSAGLLHFAAANATALESGGHAFVTVVRTGGAAGPATVFWKASGHTRAKGPKTTTSGTLSFAVGQVAAGFSVAFAPDGVAAGDRPIALTLSDATGAALGNPAAATLTLKDVDKPPPGRPKAVVSIARHQIAAGNPGVALSVRPNSTQRLQASGVVTLGTQGRFALGTVRRGLTKGRANKLVVGFRHGAWKRMNAARRGGQPVLAHITLRFTDPLGRHLTIRRRVRIVG